MKHLKFRAWDKEKEEWYGSSSPDMLTFYGFHLFGECALLCTPPVSYLSNIIITQFSGLQDSKGVDIYEGDIVYIAGYGDYTVEFPFTELYDAMPENDVGEIKGTIYGGKSQDAASRYLRGQL